MDYQFVINQLVFHMKKYGCHVSISNVKQMLSHANVEGYYYSSTNNIEIYYDEKDLEEILCILSHEIGHVCIRMKDIRCSYFVEEELAWEYGRSLLTSIGYSHWEYFDSLRKKCLDSYK